MNKYQVEISMRNGKTYYVPTQAVNSLAACLKARKALALYAPRVAGYKVYPLPR